MDLREKDILDILQDGNLSDIEYLSDIEIEIDSKEKTVTPPEIGCDSEPGAVDYSLQFLSDDFPVTEEIVQTSDLLEFRTRITNNLINVGQPVVRRKRGRPASVIPQNKTREEVQPPKAVRQDSVDHLPEVDTKKEATCCKRHDCTGKTHIFCIKSQVHLCLMSYRNCFLLYHT